MTGRQTRELSFSAELEAADNLPTHIYDFITPQYDALNSGSDTDATQLSLEDDEDYQEDEEENEEEENERYSRQRSRSRSFNEHDEITSIVTPVDPSTFSSNVLQAANDALKKSEIIERSGPLQQREVLALKKVSLIPLL
jgi:hypothetical protein